MNKPTSLLDFLGKILSAFNTVPRFRVPAENTDSYRIAAEIDSFIRAIKEGENPYQFGSEAFWLYNRQLRNPPAAMNDHEKVLRECPFCGHGDSLYVRHVEGTILHPAYYVECDYCGAKGPTSDKGDHAGEWNRRAAIGERGEPVATVCLRGDRYAHGHMIEVQLQLSSPDVELPIGTKLYAALPTPPTQGAQPNEEKGNG